jgi:Tfp pilus assembly protein PilF
MEILKAALGVDRNLRIAHFDLATLYADAKQNELAIAQFREAVRIDPERPDAHYRLARLYQELGRRAEASAEFAAVKKFQQRKQEEPTLQLRRAQEAPTDSPQ